MSPRLQLERVDSDGTDPDQTARLGTPVRGARRQGRSPALDHEKIRTRAAVELKIRGPAPAGAVACAGGAVPVRHVRVAGGGGVVHRPGLVHPPPPHPVLVVQCSERGSVPSRSFASADPLSPRLPPLSSWAGACCRPGWIFYWPGSRHAGEGGCERGWVGGGGGRVWGGVLAGLGRVWHPRRVSGACGRCVSVHAAGACWARVAGAWWAPSGVVRPAANAGTAARISTGHVH